MSLFAISNQPEVVARRAAHEAAAEAVAYAEAATIEQIGTDWSMLALSQEMAARLGVPLDAVFHCLYAAPVNLHEMLATHQGWTVMANYIAREFDCEPWQYKPQVH